MEPSEIREMIREDVKIAVSDAIQEVLPPMMRFFATRNDLQTFRNNIIKDFDASVEAIKQGFDDDLRFLVRNARDTQRTNDLILERMDETSSRLTTLEGRVSSLEERVGKLE